MDVYTKYADYYPDSTDDEMAENIYLMCRLDIPISHKNAMINWLTPNQRSIFDRKQREYPPCSKKEKDEWAALMKQLGK
jgi:hypothetical protein